ncbi:MAG TPA: hypothetical protein VMF61_14520 [Candidatus Acidoferrales bacterium]|nr:hypothetical protein [Candidatus Acidoferrales bacterium]
MKRLISRIGIVPRTFALGLVLGTAVTGTAWAYQTHMWNAIHDLQAAQNELSQATADKGGHRNSAMNLINQAINQVHLGINYANR